MITFAVVMDIKKFPSQHMSDGQAGGSMKKTSFETSYLV